jgi:hypothetical protein
VDLLAHPVAERAVHELVLANLGQTLERRADDDSFPVVAVAVDFDVLAAKGFRDGCPDGFRRDHG